MRKCKGKFQNTYQQKNESAMALRALRNRFIRAFDLISFQTVASLTIPVWPSNRKPFSLLSPRIIQNFTLAPLRSPRGRGVSEGARTPQMELKRGWAHLRFYPLLRYSVKEYHTCIYVYVREQLLPDAYVITKRNRASLRKWNKNIVTILLFLHKNIQFWLANLIFFLTLNQALSLIPLLHRNSHFKSLILIEFTLREQNNSSRRE